MLGRGEHVVVETLLSAEDTPGLGLGILDTGYEAFREEFRRTAVLPMRLSLWAAFRAAIWVAPLLIGRLPPLGRLAREERIRALTRLTTHPAYLLRQLGMMLKMNVCLTFGADRRVQRFVGYPVQFDEGHHGEGR